MTTTIPGVVAAVVVKAVVVDLLDAGVKGDSPFRLIQSQKTTNETFCQSVVPVIPNPSQPQCSIKAIKPTPSCLPSLLLTGSQVKLNPLPQGQKLGLKSKQKNLLEKMSLHPTGPYSCNNTTETQKIKKIKKSETMVEIRPTQGMVLPPGCSEIKRSERPFHHPCPPGHSGSLLEDRGCRTGPKLGSDTWPFARLPTEGCLKICHPSVGVMPVGGRLMSFQTAWNSVIRDKFVLSVVTRGYHIQWLTNPPPLSNQPKFTVLHNQADLLRKEIMEMKNKNAIEEVPIGTQGYCSTFFLVPKKDSSDMRPVINLKKLNKFIHTPTFKMHTPLSVLRLIKKNSWLASIDLKDAYFHVPMNPSFYKYLRFAFDNQMYQFKVLPFGLSTAPRIFTKMLAPVVGYLHQLGIYLYPYLDDCLLVAKSRQELNHSIQVTLTTLQSLGFLINFRKSHLEMTQRLTFLGMEIDSLIGSAFLPKQKSVTLASYAMSFLPVGTYKTAREYLRLLGLMTSSMLMVPHARLYMRPIQIYLNASWNRKTMTLKHQIVTPFRLVRTLLGQPNDGTLICQTAPVNDSDHRCLNASLGRSLCRQICPGEMESTPPYTPHQRIGADGSLECTQSLSSSGKKPPSPDSNGQYLGSPLHKQFRGNQINSAMSDHMGHASLVHGPQNRVESNSHTRERQCLGGQALPTSCESHRVVFERSSAEQIIQSLADPDSGLVCQPAECKTNNILLAEISSSSSVYGCSDDELAESVRVCVPTICDPVPGTSKSFPGTSYIDSDSSDVEQARVVSSPSRPDYRLSTDSSSPIGSDHSAGGNDASPRPGIINPDCLEGEREQLIASGLSQQAVNTCLSSLSTSTRKAYSSGWNDFSKWSAENGIDPFTASVPNILNYFQSLFDRGLIYNTVKARSTCIARHHHDFRDKIGTDQSLLKLPIVTSFFRGALVEHPPVKDLAPAWDLPTVLIALSKPPFEPIEDISLKHLTIKTAFLVAMASAGRTAELKAFDRRPLYCTRSDRGVVLRVPQTFRPKVLRVSNIGRTMEFTPLISHEHPPNPEVEAVCVCRAINAYIQATDPLLQDNCSQLFVTFQKGKQGKAASKITIAAWLKQCIMVALGISNEPREKVKAHSTRKQSASWAALKNISIKDICQQATWSTPHVFMKHYKLDIPRSVSAKHAQAVLTARH
jgi:hypothetical protein